MKCSLLVGGVFVVAFVLVAAGAAEDESRSPAAREARARYAGKVAQAEREAREKAGAARAELIDALDKAKDAATKAANLDEAVRLRDEVVRLKKEDAAAAAAPKGDARGGGADLKGRAALAGRLAGTQWASPHGVTVRFNADGTAADSRPNVKARWAAIDERTVVIEFGEGWVDVWRFDEGLKKVHAEHGRMGDGWEGVRKE